MDYRKYLEKQHLFDTYQKDRGLDKESLHRLIDALPREIKLREMDDKQIIQSLDNTRLIGVYRTYAGFHYELDGRLQLIAYLAPDENMKASMTGIIECRMMLPPMMYQPYLDLLDAFEKQLPEALCYPFKEGRDLLRAAQQKSTRPHKREKKKRLPHPPVSRQYSWHHEIGEDLGQRIQTALELGEVMHAQKKVIDGILYSEEIDYRLDEDYWRIYVTLPHLPTFKARVPCPKLRTLQDVAEEEYQVVAIIEALDKHICLEDTAKKLHRIASIMPPHAREHVKVGVDPQQNAFDVITEAFHQFVDQKHLLAEQMLLSRERREQFQQMVAARPYHEFMYRAKRQRKVICYIAPTNSGKSWRARHDLLERLNHSGQHKHAALFPLRMLALENQLWFHEHETAASLITGEERDIDPNAQILCQTVETLDVSQRYDSLLVDEAQLTFSADRGPAYLRALVAADCETLVLTASPECRDQLKLLFDSMDETVEFIELERLCPLIPLKKELGFRQVQTGDLIVVFSTKVLHDLAEQLQQQGFSVGTLYGSMPPTARRHMMASYQAGEIDVMVATDAIGLGCNCPVRRVLFAQTYKYDGKGVRELSTQEFKQIAGRAGRYGLEEKGYFGTLNTEMFAIHELYEVVEEVTSLPSQEPMKALYALPDREVFAESHFTLKETLESWIVAIKQSSPDIRYRFHAESITELAHKSVFLDRLIAKGLLDRELATRLLFVAFSYDQLGSRFQEWVTQVVENKAITYMDDIDLHHQPRESLESIAKTLSMLAQFQRIVPKLCSHEKDIMKAHQTVGEMIFNDLNQRYTQKRMSDIAL